MSTLLLVMQTFTDRGFLSKIIFANKDLERLADIDDELASCISGMQLSLQSTSLRVQKVSYEEMLTGNKRIMEKIEALGGEEVGVAAVGVVSE